MRSPHSLLSVLGALSLSSPALIAVIIIVISIGVIVAGPA